jgi:ribosomal protein S18 acetylase RimI-like enzyme
MQIEIIQSVTDELVGAFARLLPQLNPHYSMPGREELEEIVASAACTLLAARDSAGSIAGVLTLVVFRTPTGVHAWIEDVVVDEMARGQGLGEALTRTGIEIAREKGARGVELTSRPAREAANRLYQRMGFKRRETNLYRLEFGVEKRSEERD